MNKMSQMKNRVSEYLWPASLEYPEQLRHGPGAPEDDVCEAPAGHMWCLVDSSAALAFQSSGWQTDLRKLSGGHGLLVHLHVPPEHPPQAIDDLRQQCNELRSDYDRLKNELQSLMGVVGRIQDVAEGDARKRFAELSAKWKRETRLASNITKKSIHPAYQQIIGMGYAVIRLILMDLAENGPEHWFWALTAITGENPITEEMAGKMEAMTEAWLKWGVTKGFLKDLTPKTKQHSQDLSASAIE
jgi:uncharacterized protein YukE